MSRTTKGQDTAPAGTPAPDDTGQTVLEGNTDPVADDAEQLDDTDDSRPARQARQYRQRLRAVEAERDELAERVAALQRAAVDDLVTRDGTVRPAALWATSDLPDVLGDDGTIDAAKLDTAIAKAAEEMGTAGPRSPFPNPWLGSPDGGDRGDESARFTAAFQAPGQ